MKIFMFNLFVSLASSNVSNLIIMGFVNDEITLNITLILYGLMMTSSILVSSLISFKIKFQLLMVSLGICIFFINFGLCCSIKSFYNKTWKLKKWLIFSNYRFVALHNEYLIRNIFLGLKLIWNYFNTWNINVNSFKVNFEIKIHVPKCFKFSRGDLFCFIIRCNFANMYESTQKNIFSISTDIFD
jgi:hypothetical protein